MPDAFTANTDQTSTITNTGTIAHSAITYRITVSNPSSGSPTFTIYVCTVAWFSNRCSGGSGTQVGGTFTKNLTTTVTSSVVPALGGSIYLQVEPAAVTSSTTVTLAALVTSPTPATGRDQDRPMTAWSDIRPCCHPLQQAL